MSELRARELPVIASLQSLYNRLPQTDCGRCLDCCRVCPPVSLVEMLRLDAIVLALSDQDRLRMLHALLRTELLGRLVLTGACPFLVDGACSIYEERPLACRQFALTSRSYYAEVLRRNQARAASITENELLRPTIQGQLPPSYCTEIWLMNGEPVTKDDSLIVELYSTVAALGTDETPIAREMFHVSYGLGFLIRCWGLEETQSRLRRLREILGTGDQESAEEQCQEWALELNQLVTLGDTLQPFLNTP
jgi:Fe-S-cluster containining protein